jgi:hypothetical protein
VIKVTLVPVFSAIQDTPLTRLYSIALALCVTKQYFSFVWEILVTLVVSSWSAVPLSSRSMYSKWRTASDMLMSVAQAVSSVSLATPITT